VMKGRRKLELTATGSDGQFQEVLVHDDQHSRFGPRSEASSDQIGRRSHAVHSLRIDNSRSVAE